jgi:hypothetical protein
MAVVDRDALAVSGATPTFEIVPLAVRLAAAVRFATPFRVEPLLAARISNVTVFACEASGVTHDDEFDTPAEQASNPAEPEDCVAIVHVSSNRSEEFIVAGAVQSDAPEITSPVVCGVIEAVVIVAEVDEPGALAPIGVVVSYPERMMYSFAPMPCVDWVTVAVTVALVCDANACRYAPAIPGCPPVRL